MRALVIATLTIATLTIATLTIAALVLRRRCPGRETRRYCPDPQGEHRDDVATHFQKRSG
jgi:hypothetical protein